MAEYDKAVATVKSKVTPALVASVGQVYVFEIGRAVSTAYTLAFCQRIPTFIYPHPNIKL